MPCFVDIHTFVDILPFPEQKQRRNGLEGVGLGGREGEIVARI